MLGFERVGLSSAVHTWAREIRAFFRRRMSSRQRALPLSIVETLKGESKISSKGVLSPTMPSRGVKLTVRFLL